MVDETPNHELHKYEIGDTDWTHSPDMQHIEERLVIRDVEANRSNYTPHSTATFIATDTGAVYDGDGSNWNKATRVLESLGVDVASIGNLNPKVSVTRDGTEAVAIDRDDGEISRGEAHETVIQDAINNLTAGRTHKERVNVVGEFELEGEIVPDSFLFLDLQNATLRVGSNWNGDFALIHNDHVKTGYDGLHQYTQLGGTLDGNKSNVSDTVRGMSIGRDSANYENTTSVQVLFTDIRNFTGTGVQARTRRGFYQQVTVVGCDLTGWDLRGSDDTYLACLSHSNGNNGWRTLGAAWLQLINCIASGGTGGNAAIIEDGEGIELRGGFYENAGTRGVYAAGGEAHRIAPQGIINNNMNNGGYPGVEVHQSVSECRIESVRFLETGDGNQNTAISVQSGATDTKIRNNNYEGETTTQVADSGTRTTIDGWGTNAGDPSSTGDWNGYGREGVQVLDTTNSVKYLYRNDGWV